MKKEITESNKKNPLKGVAKLSKPNAKITKNAKNKVKKVDAAKVEDALPMVEVKKVAITTNGGAQPEKKNKGKKQKENKNKDIQGTVVKANGKAEEKKDEKDLTTSDIAKIEKKQAKKLAQKLKKQGKKSQGGDENKEDIKKKPKTVNTTDKKDKKQKQNKEKIAKSATPEAGKNVTTVATTPKDPKLIEKKKLRAAKKLKQKEERKRNEGEVTRDPAITAATVFVGNLPVNTKRVQLVKLFDAYQPVNAVRFRTAGGKVIFKHKHRTEAGTLNAYVVLKDADTATRALALNGTEFKGNHLRVTNADMNSQNRGEGDSKRMIFVGNLKYSATEEKLREIFSSCGEIEYVRCLRDGEKGCRGVAYVCFKAPEAVGLAMELNETMLDERPIHVERYSVKKLGAKQARDASAEAENKKSPKTGAKKRLEVKNKKQQKSGSGAGKPSARDDGGDERKKKSEFRGVKVGGVSKKPNKKKKPTSQMQQLAKKIAPKAV